MVIERIKKPNPRNKNQELITVVEHERRFFIVPDLLASSGTVNFRNIGDDYFVIVPPNQPKVDVKLVAYPGESDRGPFPVPDSLPIEGWPKLPAKDGKHLMLDSDLLLRVTASILPRTARTQA